jgi:glyoxylase-like metal-dependent hydrolase (beta-lactamase superfamily II)
LTETWLPIAESGKPIAGGGTIAGMERVEYRVVSIGTLAAHPLWDERTPVRTGHATTTLICTGRTNLLIDPALPGEVLAARLNETSRVKASDITHIFLTSFEPERRRGLVSFDHAEWLMHEPEIEAARAALMHRLDEAESRHEAELAAHYRNDLELLRNVKPAPDSLAANVDLFPLPGVTPGTCGVLLALPMMTVLITGDAVATVEHLEQGKVLPACVDVEQAQESFREAIEIADVIVPGRGNVLLNPMRRGQSSEF